LAFLLNKTCYIREREENTRVFKRVQNSAVSTSIPPNFNVFS